MSAGPCSASGSSDGSSRRCTRPDTAGTSLAMTSSSCGTPTTSCHRSDGWPLHQRRAASRAGQRGRVAHAKLKGRCACKCFGAAPASLPACVFGSARCHTRPYPGGRLYHRTSCPAAGPPWPPARVLSCHTAVPRSAAAPRAAAAPPAGFQPTQPGPRPRRTARPGWTRQTPARLRNRGRQVGSGKYHTRQGDARVREGQGWARSVRLGWERHSPRGRPPRVEPPGRQVVSRRSPGEPPGRQAGGACRR